MRSVRPQQPGPNLVPERAPGASLLPAIIFIALICTTGCTGLFHKRETAGTLGSIQNPLFIPPVDRELLWNQTVDAIDDYFRIEREDRVRQIGGVLTEGRIDTFPTTGSTVFEPWRRDSTSGYEKIHATLQSIRRRANVRMISVDGGYFPHVAGQRKVG